MATMVMIPKTEEGKWRLIAILVAPYRIWARRAGEDVSLWAESMAKKGMKWIAYGPKKSSEHATYEAALRAEACGGKYEEIAITAT